MINSGFADRAADGVAEKLLAVRSGDRVGHAYRLIYSRPPSGEERSLAESFVAEFSSKQTSSDRSEHAAWKSLCKMLLASNEFHYVD